MKMKKKDWKLQMARVGTGMILSILMMLLLAVSAFASELPDPDRTGSMTLNFKYQLEGKTFPVTDGELELIQVARGTIEDGKYILVPQGVFGNENFSLDLNQTEDFSGKNVIDTVYSYAMTYEESIHAPQRQQAEPDKSGTVVWNGMDTGLYLIHQTKASENCKTMNPFLVTIPLVERNEDGEVTGFIYDVDASPKAEPVEYTPPETETPEPPTPEPPTPEPPTPEPPTPTPPTPTPPTPPKLPQTGQLWWPVWIMIGIGVICLVTGLLLANRKKRTNR